MGSDGGGRKGSVRRKYGHKRKRGPEWKHGRQDGIMVE